MMCNRISQLLCAALLAVLAGDALADLRDLSDAELSEVDGAGMGLVLEDFKFAHGTDIENGQIFRIGGIKSSQGEDVEIIVNKLYIAAAGSNYGGTLEPVNLGRLINPYRIDVVDGDDIGVPDKAVLEFAAPRKMANAEGYDCMSASAGAGSGTCASRPATADLPQGERPDIGLQLNFTVGEQASANINVHAQSAVIDGSVIRLWGDDERNQLVGQFKLNFYTPELSINACDQDTAVCGSRILMRHFALELALGNALQPMYLDVDGSGNFVLEVDRIRQPLAGEIGSDGLRASSDGAAWDYYEGYYTNPEYRSSVTIGNLTVGDRDFGSGQIKGMLIQHLKIRTKDLAP
ncbi:hypothetical protein [Marinobacter sp. JSM 1782161]|uniref:hypothetical protein n=1 Tax=Marinobacter sp. JSM 1782161 TaxID=2685906 RepID=UPI001D194BFA|nr:hypothetical protein [Marinobacter sp. JSM 1782161]